VYAFGRNDACQLGVRDAQDRYTPYPVSVKLPVADREITLAAAGARHSVLVVGSGAVYVLGDDTDGPADDGAPGEPRLVTPAVDDDYPVQVAAGAHRSAVVMQSGAVFVWGDDAFGQLGVGEASLEPRADPTYIHLLEAFRVQRIALGARHSVFVTEEGAAYVFFFVFVFVCLIE
jgi:alpha-tubulin suppressor-like RCC1 family protein